MESQGRDSSGLQKPHLINGADLRMSHKADLWSQRFPRRVKISAVYMQTNSWAWRAGAARQVCLGEEEACVCTGQSRPVGLTKRGQKRPVLPKRNDSPMSAGSAQQGGTLALSGGTSVAP